MSDRGPGGPAAGVPQTGSAPGSGDATGTRQSLILALACLAQFMVVLDVSIVNVALPSIKTSLHYSPSGLQWVVNAYVLTFAGFLLLGGRCADLFGRRRTFLAGLVVFSAASLVGGLAQDAAWLTAARAVQGLGGAILAPASLTIIMTTFQEGTARTRAIGAWSAVAGAGGAFGAVLGGVLTSGLSWRWVLFVNVPIGVFALVAGRLLLTETRRPSSGRLDVPGAVVVTGGLALLVYGIVGTTERGWSSPITLVSLTVAAVLLGGFLVLETRVASPLVPLRLFRSRSVSGANVIMLLVGCAFFSFWYFLSLFMQQVLHYDALKAGLAFLPMGLVIIVGAQLGARAVGWAGVRVPIVIGLWCAAGGLVWLSSITDHSGYLDTILWPGMLVAFGIGLLFAPLAATATTGVAPAESGLASGLVNTSRQVGGSIGLAVLATVATSRTEALLHAGHSATAVAVTSGYARAFAVGAVFLVAGVGVSVFLPSARRRRPAPATSGGEAPSPRPAQAEA
jgi:EmrB/QacA subfamily drug resistance transporter